MKRLLLTLLLNSYCLWGAASTSGEDQLHNAVKSHNVSKVTELLSTGANPNGLDNKAHLYDKFRHSGRNTPLHIALDKYRNNINNPDQRFASYYLDIAKLLIPRTDVFINNEAQATPLHMIAGFSYDINPAWLDRHPDIKLKMDEKEGILFGSSREKKLAPLVTLASQIVERARAILIDRGYGDDAINQTLYRFINAKDELGRTALHWAAIHGYIDLVAYLISMRADVNAKSHDVKEDGTTYLHNQGATPLMNAAKKGNLNIMRQLISAGADVNAHDTIKGRTALQWVIRMREGAALKHGNQMSKEMALQAIQMLLEAGANPDSKDQPWVDSEGKMVPGRSAVKWSELTSPWPEYDNQELNLLRAYSNEARVAALRITPPAIDRSKKNAPAHASTPACSSQPPRINRAAKPAASAACAPPLVSRATKPQVGWWQRLAPRDKEFFVDHAEHFSSNQFSQDVIESAMKTYGDSAGIKSLNDAIEAGDSLAIRFRDATGM